MNWKGLFYLYPFSKLESLYKGMYLTKYFFFAKCENLRLNRDFIFYFNITPAKNLFDFTLAISTLEKLSWKKHREMRGNYKKKKQSVRVCRREPEELNYTNTVGVYGEKFSLR